MNCWLKILFLASVVFTCNAFWGRRRRRWCQPRDCAWKFESCSATCGEGVENPVKVRLNYCGGKCDRPAPRHCNITACPDVCKVSEWGELGPCSVTCGPGGVRVRRRTIEVSPLNIQTECPPLQEAIPCEKSICLNGGKYTAWNTTKFACFCPNGWTGTCCEKDVANCMSNSSVTEQTAITTMTTDMSPMRMMGARDDSQFEETLMQLIKNHN